MPVTDLCVEYAVGSTLKMNEGGVGGTTTTIHPTSITGLDGKPIQGTIVPNSATSGSDKLTHQFRGRVIRVQGEILVYSAGVQIGPAPDLAAYLGAVNTLVSAWISGLESFLNSTFTLAWTPTGLGAQSLTVTYGTEGGEFQSTPSPDLTGPPTVTFTLFAESG